MLKVIDLDSPSKDSDGYVFTLTVGAEKVGVTDLELADLIKARHAAGGKGGRRQPQKRTNAQDASSQESSLDGSDQGNGQGNEGGGDLGLPSH